MRTSTRCRCWPATVGVGLPWLRNLLDLLLERNRLQALAAQSEWNAVINSLPQAMSIEDRELSALRMAILRLPRLKSLPEPGLLDSIVRLREQEKPVIFIANGHDLFRVIWHHRDLVHPFPYKRVALLPTDGLECAGVNHFAPSFVWSSRQAGTISDPVMKRTWPRGESSLRPAAFN